MTYTYNCRGCDYTFETKQSIHDDALTDCPKCNERKLVKVITPAGGFRIGGLGVHRPTSMYDN